MTGRSKSEYLVATRKLSFASIFAVHILVLGSPSAVAQEIGKGAAPPAPAQAELAPAGSTNAPAPTNVGANLNISPKRMTFDRLGRSATVFIFNQGTNPATFEISLIDRVMLPDGQIDAISEMDTKPELKPFIDKLKSAKSMLVAVPRRATLAPGEGQTIRVRVASGQSGGAEGSLLPGEYRSHLTVTTLPPRDIGLTAEQAAAGDSQQLSFRINTAFGISIPVIVRLGAVDIRGSIETPTLVTKLLSIDGKSPAKPTAVMRIQLARLGGNSLFGNLEVRGAKESGGREPLGSARGVGVYTEIDRREIEIPLKRVPSSKEKLEITFVDDDTSPGKVIAKTLFITP